MLAIIYALCNLINRILCLLLVLGVGLAIFGVIGWGKVGYVALAIVAIIVISAVVSKIATRGMSPHMRKLWIKGII